ncbi:MAG: sigma-54 dependent transcriptional regulator [bacterium]
MVNATRPLQRLIGTTYHAAFNGFFENNRRVAVDLRCFPLLIRDTKKLKKLFSLTGITDDTSFQTKLAQIGLEIASLRAHRRLLLVPSGTTFKTGEVVNYRNYYEHGSFKVPGERKEQRRANERFCIVGRSLGINEVMVNAQLLAASDLPVLISGETGTGKERLARFIHNASLRAGGAFVVVDATSITESLAESILFGHTRGAFTGAVAEKKGLFELADHGTLFIDEVGELPETLQPKFLRAAEEQSFIPVGGEKPKSVDVRVVSATNRDLEQQRTNDLFRTDLFYRLGGNDPIIIPPLRQRMDDLPLLVRHVLDRERTKRKVSAAVLSLLGEYHWPGNIRELFHSVGVGSVRSSWISLDDLALEAFALRVGETAPEESVELRASVAEVKKARIIEALLKTDGNVMAAAALLNTSQRTLYRKIGELGLVAEHERIKREAQNEPSSD